MKDNLQKFNTYIKQLITNEAILFDEDSLNTLINDLQSKIETFIDVLQTRATEDEDEDHIRKTCHEVIEKCLVLKFDALVKRHLQSRGTFERVENWYNLLNASVKIDCLNNETRAIFENSLLNNAKIRVDFFLQELYELEKLIHPVPSETAGTTSLPIKCSEDNFNVLSVRLRDISTEIEVIKDTLSKVNLLETQLDKEEMPKTFKEIHKDIVDRINNSQEKLRELVTRFKNHNTESERECKAPIYKTSLK